MTHERAGALANSALARLTRQPPVYLAAIAILCGDALGNCRWAVPLSFALLLATVGGLFFLAGRPTAGVSLALLAIAGAATLPAKALISPDLSAASISRFPEAASIEIEGRLTREIEQMEGRTRLYVSVERAAGPGDKFQPKHGVVRVTLLEPAEFRIGQRLRLAAKLRYPRNYGDPGEFDYQGYMAREGISATTVLKHASDLQVIGSADVFPASEIERIRSAIGSFIDSNLNYPERQEMRALIIGDRSGIDPVLRQKFALTGMAHMLVISGLHLGLVASAAFAVARLAMWLFPALMIRGWANKIAAMIAGVAVASYASIAGGHISTVRALIMVLSYVLAIVLDRSREVVAALALAAIVICVGWPGSTADIGFQLSFASVLSIVLGMRLYARWQQRFEQTHLLPAKPTWRLWRTAGAIGGYLAVSFWALIGTAPLTAFHFNQFSLIGVCANALVVPIMGFGGVVSGLAAAALSFVNEPFAGWVLWGAGCCLRLGTAMAGMFMAWPGAWVRVFTPTPLELALVYGLLLHWLVRPVGDAAAGGIVDSAVAHKRERAETAAGVGVQHRFASWRGVSVSLLLVVLAVDAAWWTYQRYFSRALRITFLSVGQGDGAVLQFPGARVMLIDAGGSFSGESDPGERIVAPYLWSRKIAKVDYLVLSHPELDHFGGFSYIARNFHPSEFWTINATSPDIKYEELLEILAGGSVRLHLVDSSMPARLIGGVRVIFLNPQPQSVETRNNSSMVLALEFGSGRVLFTGDLEAKGERLLLEHKAELRATVLKVPHHGSKTSSSAAFVEAVSPRYAVISLGYHNRYHFPSGEVLDRYHQAKAEVLRTDQVGAVMAEFTRQGLTIWTARDGSGSGIVPAP